MRLGLIGSLNHWQTYAPALKTIPNLELAAVAPGGEDETLGGFDHAPGLTVNTKRYAQAQKMLEEENLDIVQVSCRNDRIPILSKACLERRIPVVAEKTIAMDLDWLTRLYEATHKYKTPILPMHTMRSYGELGAMQQAIARGDIGEPFLGFSQKSYKWGDSRPNYYKNRRTFAGLAPWIGIHAIDWLFWMLGDVFVKVQGRESTIHPEFQGCATQGSYLYTLKNGGTVVLTCDYLRPKTAPTHNDEHIRIAGTKGVIECTLIEKKVTLINQEGTPKQLELKPTADIFTRFVRSLQGTDTAPVSLHDTFRITEIALKTQEAADTGKVISLENSPFKEK